MLDPEIGQRASRMQRDIRTSGRINGMDLYDVAKLTRQRDERLREGLQGGLVGDTLRALPGSVGGAVARVSSPLTAAGDIWAGREGGASAELFAAVREDRLDRITRGDATLEDFLDLFITSGFSASMAAPVIGVEALSMARGGTSYYSYRYSYDLEAGNAFQEYIGMGMDPMIAARRADMAGNVNANIEPARFFPCTDSGQTSRRGDEAGRSHATPTGVK